MCEVVWSFSYFRHVVFVFWASKSQCHCHMLSKWFNNSIYQKYPDIQIHTFYPDIQICIKVQSLNGLVTQIKQVKPPQFVINHNLWTNYQNLKFCRKLLPSWTSPRPLQGCLIPLICPAASPFLLDLPSCLVRWGRLEPWLHGSVWMQLNGSICRPMSGPKNMQGSPLWLWHCGTKSWPNTPHPISHGQ